MAGHPASPTPARAAPSAAGRPTCPISSPVRARRRRQLATQSPSTKRLEGSGRHEPTNRYEGGEPPLAPPGQSLVAKAMPAGQGSRMQGHTYTLRARPGAACWSNVDGLCRGPAAVLQRRMRPRETFSRATTARPVVAVGHIVSATPRGSGCLCGPSSVRRGQVRAHVGGTRVGAERIQRVRRVCCAGRSTYIQRCHARPDRLRPEACHVAPIDNSVRATTCLYPTARSHGEPASPNEAGAP